MNNDKEMLTMCKNIARARQKGGLSKTEMARLMGVSVKTVTAIEGGIVPDRFGVVSIIKVCKYLNCRPKEIFEKEL